MNTKCFLKKDVIKSNKELDEVIEMLAVSFAGTTNSVPEGIIDWLVGEKYRTGPIYEKLEAEPSEKRLLIYRDFATFQVYRGWILGKILIVRDSNNNNKIVGAIILEPYYQTPLWKKPYFTLKEIYSMHKALRKIGEWFRFPKWMRNDDCIKSRIEVAVDIFTSSKKEVLTSKQIKTCYYASMIGTHPSLQGQGVGSFLMSSLQDVADAENIPVYLEASGEKNSRFYSKFDFKSEKIVETISVPNKPKLVPYSHVGGLHFMVRAPISS